MVKKKIVIGRTPMVKRSRRTINPAPSETMFRQRRYMRTYEHTKPSKAVLPEDERFIPILQRETKEASHIAKGSRETKKKQWAALILPELEPPSRELLLRRT